MKNKIKLFLNLWIILFTFLNANAQCETIIRFFKDDMYTSKELVAFSETNPQKAFDSWKVLHNEKTGLTRNIEELTLVSKNLDEIKNVGGYLKWKSLKEPIDLLKVLDEDGYAVIRGVNNEFVARGWLGFDNELNLTIITKGTTLEGKGRAVFQSLFNFINTEYDEILKIRGTWRSNDTVADNLNSFNDFIKNGMSPNEAALKTFTGKMAIEHKFTKANVLPTSITRSDGTYSSVDVLFTK
ncbi:hypothetical protein [Flavobacterium collinsii]|uniref:Uncharacterized protein n=1 Tax=Flavobacterium collinsii TaxID=1114861 RepID=A0ABN7EMP4_9FLAO|nr:hypothetical protein [Flavobacterium collinsii]CAA9200775.1 hypothetical protein FLACOL7796_03436 [Flavobacterium collinsii]